MQAFCQCISPGNSTFLQPDPHSGNPFFPDPGRPACSWPPCRSKTPRRRPFLSGPDSFPGPQKECSRFPISGPSQTSMARADPQAAPPFPTSGHAHTSTVPADPPAGPLFPAPAIRQIVYMISLEMSSFPTHLPFPLRPAGRVPFRISSCESGASLSDVSYYQYMQPGPQGAGQAAWNQKKPGRIMVISCSGSWINSRYTTEKATVFNR